MSGAEDLARLTATIDTANELLLSDQIKMVDVGGGVMRPTNAMVMANLAAQLGGAMPYATVEDGISKTENGTNFSVISNSEEDYVILYRNSAGVAIEVARYPSSAALKAVLKMIHPNGSADIFWNVNDVSGGMLGYFGNDKFRLPMLEFYKTSDGGFSVIDPAGGVSILSSPERLIVGPLEARYVDLPGIYIVNEKGDVLNDLTSPDAGSSDHLPLQDGVVFAPTLATFSGFSTKIYTQSMLPRRNQYTDVVASIASTTTDESASGDILEVQGSKLGGSAILNIREKSNPSSRLFVPLQVASVPLQTGSPTISVLLIGDSVANRQGAQYVQQYLVEMGFNPIFLGTVNGSANAASSGNAAGPLGECREGWESSDFTNYASDRAILIENTQAAVDAYLALSKNDKMERNPFLRVATSSDSADLIENGRVFDAVFYKTRFSIADPDVIINLLGTNDVRKRDGSVIYGVMSRSERIMHSQMRVAWPNAKILRGMPGTPYNNERNEVWSSRYVPAIKAMRDSIRALANSKTVLVPAWAFTNPDVGYAQSGVPGEDYSYKADWADALHPLGASKVSLFKSIAPYVAAAKLNLI